MQRRAEILVSGAESGFECFRADQMMIASCAADRDTARIRVHRSSEPGVALGRFHRLAPGAVEIRRRLTGGRAVPVGPGVAEVTAVIPSADWLEPRQPPLLPEQILNRSLRPLLALVRSRGTDVFFPGRDLLTVDGATVAVASFTVLPDGMLVVEQFIAVEDAFDRLETLMPRLDPQGVAAVELSGFAGSARVSVLSGLDWGEATAEAVTQAWHCPATIESPAVLLPQASGLTADESAYEAFRCERGPARPNRVEVVALTMLGAVEASAEIHTGRIHALEICGDLIAPFSTLEELSRRCEGEPTVLAAMRRVVATLLLDRGHFLLGASELDVLLSRLAG